MEFTDFLRKRRQEIGITQVELANRLSDRGHETSHARVGHWETGRNKPPLNDPHFREVLAASLEIDENVMMATLGYVIYEDQRSEEALLAASIVDRLPPDVREFALEYLVLLEKRYATHEI